MIMYSANFGGKQKSSSHNFSKFLHDLINSSLSDIVDHEFVFSRPSVNIMDTADAMKIELAAPGIRKEDFKIDLKEGRLKVSAQVQPEGEDETYQRREFDYRQFTRTFKVTENINKQGIEARYENGVLYIYLPKLVKTESETEIKVN